MHKVLQLLIFTCCAKMYFAMCLAQARDLALKLGRIVLIQVELGSLPPDKTNLQNVPHRDSTVFLQEPLQAPDLLGVDPPYVHRHYLAGHLSRHPSECLG